MGRVALMSELSWRLPYNLDFVTARGVYAIPNVTSSANQLGCTNVPGLSVTWSDHQH